MAHLVVPGRGDGMERDPGHDNEKKIQMVRSEVERVKLLPATSSYAVHRLRVLNKLLLLLSVEPDKRSNSDVDELEQLFAGMSFGGRTT